MFDHCPVILLAIVVGLSIANAQTETHAPAVHTEVSGEVSEAFRSFNLDLQTVVAEGVCSGVQASGEYCPGINCKYIFLYSSLWITYYNFF